MPNNKSGSILTPLMVKVILALAVLSLVIGIIVYYGGKEEEIKTPDTPPQLPVPNQPPAAPPGGQPPAQPPAQPDPVRDYIIKNLPVKLVTTFPKSFVLNNSGLVAVDSTVTNDTSIDPNKFNTQLPAMAQAIISGSDCISKYSGDLSVFDACISYLGWMCDRNSAIYQVYSSTQQTNTLPNPWKVYGFDCTLVQK